jgi:hypothetical protein
MGALLLELDEQWSTGHRYLEMQTYWQWRGRIPSSQSARLLLWQRCAHDELLRALPAGRL